MSTGQCPWLKRRQGSSGKPCSSARPPADFLRLGSGLLFVQSAVQFARTAVESRQHVVESAVLFSTQRPQEVRLKVDGKRNDLIMNVAALRGERQNRPAAIQRIDPAIHQTVIDGACDGAADLYLIHR